MGFRPHTSQGQSQVAKISLWNFSCFLWETSQPSCDAFALPSSHVVMKWFLLSALGYKSSLQLMFSWLFRMISLQFSCNSSLVLGGGLYSFHLLLCHLVSLGAAVFRSGSGEEEVVSVVRRPVGEIERIRKSTGNRSSLP